MATNQEYLEMTCVKETATGRGNNQKIEMENLHNGYFRVTESRIGITIGRHRPRSYTLPVTQWEEFFQGKLSRGYLVTKHQKMEKKVIQYLNTVDGHQYKKIPDPDVDRIVTKILEYADASVSQNYSVDVENISDEMIRYGREILDEMSERYQTMSVAEFNIKLRTLYAAIPRRIDNLSKSLAKSPNEIRDIVAQEQELYDIMVNRVRSGQEFSADRTILESFGLEWRRVTPEEEDRIKKKLGISASKYKEAWSIRNRKTADRFQAFCEMEALGEGNGICHLFHGSRNENFWSILTNGLTINPQNVVISGKMFGNGTYFAVDADKSLGYTSYRNSRWAHGSSDVGYLAICRVATGKQYNLDSSQSDLTWKKLQQRCPGAHCVWAHAGVSLYRDEIIVYQDCQSTIEYLVEMAV